MRLGLYDDGDGAGVEREALEEFVHLVVHVVDALALGSADQLREYDYCVHVVVGGGGEKVDLYWVFPVDELERRHPARKGLAVFVVNLFSDLATGCTQRSRCGRR